MNRLPAYGDIMIRHFGNMADSWQPGQVVRAKDELYGAVAGILGEAAVGRDLDPGETLVREALRTVKWDYALDYLPFKSLVRKLPLPQNLALWRSLRELHEIIAEPRRCPAWQFNTMAGVFLLAAIALRFRLQAASSEPLLSEFKLLFAPKGPVPVRVMERERRPTTGTS